MNDVASGRLERVLGLVLKTGSWSSTALLAVGLLLQLAGVNHGLSGALTGAGLVVLMATPVVRVVVSVADYALERDWTFLALTGSVLAILLGSLFYSIR